MKARFCIDWDDTLVEDRWPDQGDWLPGAVEALHELNRHGDIIIYSCRVSRWQFPSRRSQEEDVPRDPEDVARDVERMSKMLQSIGMGHVEIWQRDYKPPASVYIDNRAVNFNGDWEDTLRRVYDLVSRCILTGGRTFGHRVGGGGSKPGSNRHPDSQAFVDRLYRWISLHDRKQLDYGSEEDPFANVRSGAKEVGLPAWVGCVIRMNDKMRRINRAAKQFIRTGRVALANESLMDSFDDLGVYSGIAAVLFEKDAEDQ
ncbi:MAG: hypothetical protein KatS3mg015_2822 [Fimbriimonadales bacterium]|nr:MAG: hypothetical protein KatS3mg015_2822 [Fimbriimonadales bacterium]